MASDVDTAMNFDRRLFERTREDADFLCVYLGKGSVESERQIDYRKQERMEVGDELTDLPEKICDMYAKIDHAPVYADLKNANAVGVVGEKKALYAMFKNIAIDISVRHYYGDVRLFLLVHDEKQYEWVRMLPHLGNEK